MSEEEKGMRLAKYLSNAGIASRRRCEELIAEGRVSVNGQVVTTPVCLVVPGKDSVTYEGRGVSIGGHEYYMLNKPKGFTCSAYDPHARRLIYDLLPESMRHLYYVGRLDRDTEGLLLLTNDGELVQAITHPSHQVEKCYVADCAGEFTDEAGRQMVNGLVDEGEELHAEEVQVIREFPDHLMLKITLAEGKKREVRRLCAAVGLEVLRLARVSVGNLRLGDLPSTQYRALTPEEVTGLWNLVREP